MSTYTQICYHLVFSTKERRPTLKEDRRPDLFRYIWGILKNRHCHLYRINGVADHVHILTSLHPTLSLADLVKDIKAGSSLWIKNEAVFPMFTYWQDGYAGFTHSREQIDPLIEYIKGQEEHHCHKTLSEELRTLLVESGIEFDERYVA
jgi:putative transposase